MINRVFIKGDCHRDFSWLKDWCAAEHTTTEDVLIILGDAGINYTLDSQDRHIKKKISKCPITLICIQGNHEKRPEPQMGYSLYTIDQEDIHGDYWIEDDFPNIMFMRNGKHIIKGKTFLIIDGAYSVDKYYRINRGARWFADEQMSDKDKKMLFDIAKQGKYYDYILTHTAPLKHEPTYLFLPMIDQSMIDKRTETIIQKIIDKVAFGHLYFGHYHDTNLNYKTNMTILYHRIIQLI